jgi:deazaflavin-dependent oxidoreductase (nitroreductase family)
MSGAANSTMTWLLGTPAAALLDERICTLRYVGPRSGRTVTLPVQYARDCASVVIAVGWPERKTWWRAMRDSRSVRIRLRGAWYDGTARLTSGTARQRALTTYRQAYPRTPDDVALVEVTVDSSNQPLLRGRKLLRTWTAWVSLGEAVGFAVPAAIGAATVAAPVAVGVPALLLAGAVEGAFLGAAQAHVLRRTCVDFPARRWIARTSAAAVFAYVMGLLPSTVAPAWPMPAVIALGVVVGTALLLSIGSAQWTVLRHFVAGAGHWIWITAVGWLAGLAVFLLVATPLWQEGQPWWLLVAIGVLAGLLMATVAAAVTGLGLVRLIGRAEARCEQDRILWTHDSGTIGPHRA